VAAKYQPFDASIRAIGNDSAKLARAFRVIKPIHFPLLIFETLENSGRQHEPTPEGEESAFPANLIST
jgi:hypothetical protein